MEQRLERLTIHRLTVQLGDLREEFNAFRDYVEARFDAIDRRFDRLEKTVADGNAALMSAILSLRAS